MSTPTAIAELRKWMKAALAEFCRRDGELLTTGADGVNERCITHHIAKYLEPFAPKGFAVDCEYNRSGSLPKKLVGEIAEVKTDDVEGQTVYPDIILHERRKNNNVLVVEAKKQGGSLEKDRQKIDAYLKELHYSWGLQLVLPTALKNGRYCFGLFWVSRDGERFDDAFEYQMSP